MCLSFTENNNYERHLFLKYERIRKSGAYNMVMDSNAVAAILELSLSHYFELLNKYGELKDKYLTENNNNNNKGE